MKVVIVFLVSFATVFMGYGQGFSAGIFTDVCPGEEITYKASVENACSLASYAWSIVGGTAKASSTSSTITVIWSASASTHSITYDQGASVADRFTCDSLGQIWNVKSSSTVTLKADDGISSFTIADAEDCSTAIFTQSGSDGFTCRNCQLKGQTQEKLDQGNSYSTLKTGISGSSFSITPSSLNMEYGKVYRFYLQETSPLCSGFTDLASSIVTHTFYPPPPTIDSIRVDPPECKGGDASVSIYHGDIASGQSFTYTIVRYVPIVDGNTCTSALDVDEIDGYCPAYIANWTNTTQQKAVSLNNVNMQADAGDFSLEAGHYTLKIESTSYGTSTCIITDSFDVEDPEELSISESESSPPSCLSGEDGSIMFTLENVVYNDNDQIDYSLYEESNSSPAFTSGHWNKGDDYEVSGLSAADYYLEVTDKCDNYFSDEITVTDGTITMDLSISTTAIVCADDGMITVSVSNSSDLAASTGYTYRLWENSSQIASYENGDLSETFDSLTAGTYTIEVTSPIGCESSQTTYSAVLNNPSSVGITVGHNDPNCYGDTGDLTIDFGTSNRQSFDFDFRYKTGTNAYTVVNRTNITDFTLATDLVPGSYSVDYKDYCRGETSYTSLNSNLIISSAPSAISFNASGTYATNTDYYLSCYDGTLSLTFAYQNGYNGSATKSVTLRLDTLNSSGEYFQRTSVNFNSTSSVLTVSDLGRGAYRAVVTDNNCGDTDMLEFNILSEASTQLTAGVTRLLKDSNNDGLFNGSDNHVSCYGVTDGELVVAVYGGVQDSDNEYYDVSLELSNGTSLDPNSHAFSNDTVYYYFENLAAGTYTVKVADYAEEAAPCSLEINSVQLTQPNQLTVSSPTISSFSGAELYNGDFYIQCKGGSVDFSAVAAGGNPAYTYTLYKFVNSEYEQQAQTEVSGSAVFTGLTVGYYQLLVDDQQACGPVSTIFELKEADAELSIESFSTIPKHHGADVVCLGDANGVIEVTVSGGVGQYTYHLSSNQTGYDRSIVTSSATATFTGLPATDTEDQLITYTFDLTDEIDCSWLNAQAETDTALTMTIPDTLKFSDWEITSTTTNGFEIPCRSDQATLAFSATGGDGAAYSLEVQGTDYKGHAISISQLFIDDNDGKDSVSTVSLQAGNYNVYVTDYLSCSSAALPVTLTQPDTLTLTEVQVDFPPCIFGLDGRIEVSAVGGFPYADGYRFRIMPNNSGETFGEDTVGGTSAVFYVPADGYYEQSYTVQVQDSNLCTTNLTVIMPPNPNPLTLDTVAVKDPSCDHGTDGVITLRTTNFTLKDGNQLLYRISGGHYESTIYDTLVTLAPDATEHIMVFENLWDTKDDLFVSGNYEIWVEDYYECTDTASQFLGGSTLRLVSPDPLEMSTYSNVPPSCVRGENGSFVIKAVGGVAPYQFSLDSVNFEASNMADASLYRVEDLSAGTYTVYLKDANFVETQPTCMASFTIILEEGVDMDFASSDITNVSCFEGTDGAIDLSIQTTYNGGSYAYEESRLSLYWIDGSDTLETGYSIRDLTKGIYTISARYEVDSLTCVEQQDFPVLAPDAPFAIDVVTVYDSPCGDSAGGRAIVSYKNGWSDSSVYYSLDGAAWTRISGSSLSLTGLTVGEHTLSLAQNQSQLCTDATTFEIGMKAMSVTLATTLEPTCSNENDGEVILIAQNAQTPEYELITSGSTNTTGVFTGLTYGTYEFQVTDLANTACTSDVITVTFNECTDDTEAVIIQAVTVLQESTCLEASDGQAVISVRGGLTPYTYMLNGTSVAETVTGLTYGSYEWVVVDALGKSDTATFLIDTLTRLQVGTIVTTKSYCAGSCNGSVTAMEITGGSGYYRVEWEDGTAGETHADLCPGVYAFTIFDTKNETCAITGEVLIEQYDTLEVQVSSMTSPNCAGESGGILEVQAVGGSNSFSYVWNTGVTGRKLSNLSGGDYIVTVTDQQLGCEVTDTFNLPDGTQLMVTDTVLTSPSCEGGSDGSIRLVVNNSSPYVLWSTGDIGTSLTGITAGTYDFSIQSGAGCSTSGSITLEDRLPLSVQETVVDNTCYGECLGTISLAISGGEGAYYVEWSTGSRSTTLRNLCNGTYTYTVSDQLGCQVSGTITIGSPDQLIISLAGKTSASCFGSADGGLSVSVSGGNGGYTYQWSNGASSMAISGVAAGSYTVTVSDSLGCSGSQSFTVDQPALLYTSGDQLTDPSCYGYSDGTIAVYPVGGTAPYTYAWNSGDTTQYLQHLAPGTYSVIVTDENGCTYSRSYVLESPSAAYLANVSYEDPICHDDATGYISLEVMGGTSPWTYEWSSGQTTESLVDIPAGAYTLTATDNHGCILEESYTLDNPDVPAISGLDDYMVMCDGGTMLLQPDGEWKSYYWVGPDETYSEASYWEVSLEGDYSLTVTDDNDCPAVKSMYLEISENALVADFIRISDVVLYEPVVFVDLTMPTPDTVVWDIPESTSITVDAVDQYTIELVFSEVGDYLIGVNATYGTCASELYKTITVTDSDSTGTTARSSSDNYVTSNIYPNPTKDKLNILINSSNREKVTIQLMNMSKTILYEGEVEGSMDYLKQMNVTHLSTGIYFIIIQRGDLVTTKRLVIVR